MLTMLAYKRRDNLDSAHNNCSHKHVSNKNGVIVQKFAENCMSCIRFKWSNNILSRVNMIKVLKYRTILLTQNILTLLRDISRDSFVTTKLPLLFTVIIDLTNGFLLLALTHITCKGVYIVYNLNCKGKSVQL